MDDGSRARAPHDSDAVCSVPPASITFSLRKDDLVAAAKPRCRILDCKGVDVIASRAKNIPLCQDQPLRTDEKAIFTNISTSMLSQPPLEESASEPSVNSTPELPTEMSNTAGARLVNFSLASTCACAPTAHLLSSTESPQPSSGGTHSGCMHEVDRSRPLSAPLTITPPETPADELEEPKWSSVNTAGGASSEEVWQSSTTRSEGSQRSNVDQAAGMQTPVASRPQGISLPNSAGMTSSQQTPEGTWLDRSISLIAENRGILADGTRIQMAVQALPSQINDTSNKSVFELLVEALQANSDGVVYITATHATAKADQSMKMVPTSPPTTPNLQHDGHDYFNSQTVFSNAALVPDYHAVRKEASVNLPGQATIAAPGSIHVAVLERYIPPSTAAEVRDFFSASRKSYLVDRLQELSDDRGTMLLIYPTKAGATTFKCSYIGPIIEPFLRQFILLNKMQDRGASTLGDLEALTEMMSFGRMHNALKSLCHALSQRTSARGGWPSTYRVIAAESKETTFDRPTWMEWFITQEESRWVQNLVEYQQTGGRMPPRDISPNALAREVVQGLRNSREEAGGVGIEVGVFVIQRSKH